MRCRSALFYLAVIAFCSLAFTPAQAAFSQSSAPIAVRIAQSGSRTAVTTMIGAPVRAHATVRADGTPLPQVAPPQFSVAPGVYSSAQSVSISCSTPGATIYYQSNGAGPNTHSPVYSNTPIAVSRSLTITAYATAPGYADSQITYGTYYITSVPDSFLYNVAGNNFWGFSGDGSPATQADVNDPQGLALDKSGNLFIADSGNNVIRKIDASTGNISTVAGTGIAGYGGDNGPALNAQLRYPYSLAFDSAGNLYIADSGNYVIRKIDMSSGTITTIAGNPKATLLGDGGPATAAQIIDPIAIAIDSSNNLYILNYYLLREVDAKTQIINTVAGGGGYGSYNNYGDGGPATSATLFAEGFALDSSGNIYIADTYHQAIREVTRKDGIINTVAGVIGKTGAFQDGIAATSAYLNSPVSVAIDRSGNLVISDGYNWRIRKVDPSTHIINTVAGNGAPCFSYGEDGPATSASVCESTGLAFDSKGDLYYSDWGIDKVRMMSAMGSVPTTPTAAPAFSVPAGSYAASQTLTLTDSTPGASIYIVVNATVNPNSPDILTGGTGYNGPLAIDGNVTISAIAVAPGHTPSDTVTASYTITQPPDSIITTVAGNGTYGSSGIGGPATSAEIGTANGIAFDPNGNMYIADTNNWVVWQVSPATGDISVFAGTGKYGLWYGGGPATSTPLAGPYGVAVDKAGNVFIADNGANMVLEVPAGSANIVQYAGNGSTSGYPTNGDGGPATSAAIYSPTALAVDSKGNLYIADSNYRVRKVTAATGIINTFAGGGNTFGDGGPATSAYLSSMRGIAFDSSDNMYIATQGQSYIRMVNAQTGIITTIAGNGNNGESGNGLVAIDAEVEPYSVAADAIGNVYFGTTRQVRKVDATTGVISAAVGIGYGGYSGDGGSPLTATTCSDYAVAMDAAGNLYVGDGCGYAVRKVTFNLPAPAPTFDPPAGAYTGPQSVTISDTAPDATIYYTTDGSNPTKNSNTYSGSITVPAGSETIKAIAVASGYGQSPIGSAAYTVTPATPVITWAAPAAITYGTALSAAQLNASASVPGTFAYSPAAGTMPSAGSQTLSVTFTPTDTTDYTTATDSVMFTVNTAPLTVTSNNVSIAFGQSIPTLTGTLTGVVPGDGITVSFSTAATSKSPVGQYPIITALTDPNSKLANYTVTNNAGVITITKATSAITWAAPAAITYGTALSATQLNATASAAGALVYSPAAGAILPAGSQTLSVTFTPTDTIDYTAATDSVTLTVNPATPAIALTSSMNPASVGQSVTFTATLNSPAGAPTGTVTFYDGATQLGSGTLASGVATYATSALALGAHSITALYSGDSNFAPVTSTAVGQTVVALSIGPAPARPPPPPALPAAW